MDSRLFITQRLKALVEAVGARGADWLFHQLSDINAQVHGYTTYPAQLLYRRFPLLCQREGILGGLLA